MPVRSLTEALPATWTRGEISVLGLARSGRAAAELLRRAGADVYASDAGTGDAVAHAGAARDAGVPVVGELEVALHFLPHQRYVAITGTNGKTTTTAIAHRLLQGLGYDAVAAGNIGTPLAEVALRERAPDWIALETSSFQLHDAPSIAPTVGILTNLSANHLDRYADVEAYFADKAHLFRNANDRSVWVSNADDPEVQQMVQGVRGTHLRFTTGPGVADGYFDRARVQLVVLGSPLIDRHDLVLLGDHNVANALAAALAVMGVDEAHRTDDARARVADALRRFRALEHRIEPAGRYGDVEWINDSKSTNVASTLVALKGMQRPTVLLLGGRHKGEPYGALSDELRRTVKLVVAYGEAAPLVEEDLSGVVPVARLGSSFDEVLARARAGAAPGDAVLLSPACSSYDMFDNYEERGRAFKRIAAELGAAP